MKYQIDIIYCLILFIVLMPVKVFADEVNSSAIINTGHMSGGYMLQLVLGLFVVLACILALAWLAKRMNSLQSSTGDMLKIIGGINIGTREKIVLLQVGSEQLLIGISPSNINKLHLLTTPVEFDSVAHGKTFAHSLAEKMGLPKKHAVKREENK